MQKNDLCCKKAYSYTKKLPTSAFYHWKYIFWKYENSVAHFNVDIYMYLNKIPVMGIIDTSGVSSENQQLGYPI